MMPWREQLRLLWRPVRFVIWMPDAALWENFTLKVAQAVGVLGLLLGSAWIVLAAAVLAFLTGLAHPLT